MTDSKACKRCETVKPLARFQPYTRNGERRRSGICYDCERAARPKRCRYCDTPNAGVTGECGLCRQRRMRERRDQARQILGGKCVRCGIVYPVTFDHINGDGARRRNNRRGGISTQHMRSEIRRIVRTGYSEVLQLLCPNCNYLKQYDRAAYDQPPAYGPLTVRHYE